MSVRAVDDVEALQRTLQWLASWWLAMFVLGGFSVAFDGHTVSSALFLSPFLLIGLAWLERDTRGATNDAARRTLRLAWAAAIAGPILDWVFGWRSTTMALSAFVLLAYVVTMRTWTVEHGPGAPLLPRWDRARAWSLLACGCLTVAAAVSLVVFGAAGDSSTREVHGIGWLAVIAAGLAIVIAQVWSVARATHDTQAWLDARITSVRGQPGGG